MIIIARKFGQLGNRLFLFAQFIAWAEEHKIRIVNPSFYEYAEYFQKTKDDFFCRYPPKSSILKGNRMAGAILYMLIYFLTIIMVKIKLQSSYLSIIHLDDDESYNLSNENFLGLAKNKRFLLAQGWLFRDEKNFIRYADLIRDFFKPTDVRQHNIEELIKKARERCDVLVGVHIRQGDYKKLMSQYFYDSDEYIKIMSRIESLFPGRRVMFLICSNEKQSEGKFSSFRFILGNSHLVEDMYSLAKCDYIIGPPSTYSMWASFYGKVPLYFIENPDSTVSLSDFKIQNA